jgi:hypothetical protein
MRTNKTTGAVERKTMQVIGAGLPRTGTMSLQAALDQLHYPCYHMETLFRQPFHVKQWHNLLNKTGAMNWEKLFSGFQAAVDAPTCFYVQELLQVYPDAKVILTVRVPESWYTSWTTLLKTSRSLQWQWTLIPHISSVRQYNKALLKKFGFHPFTLSQKELLHNFEVHNRMIQETVPAERLLVFRVQEGWEPLCQFLGCDIPKTPFPHLNTGADTLRKKLYLLLGAELILLTAVLAVLLVLLK